MIARYHLVLVALLLSIVAATARQGVSEADVIKALEAKKAKIRRAPDDPIFTIELPGPAISDDELRLVGMCRGVTALTLKKTNATDAGLKAVLPKLAGTLGVLHLEGGAFTDAVMPAVAGIKGLNGVGLGGRLTDAGLSHLGGQRQLSNVTLHGAGFTDAGLGHLAALPELRRLTLLDTGVTGTGLADLAGAKKLTEVVVARIPMDRPGPRPPIDLKGAGRLPSVRSLTVIGRTIPDGGLAGLAAMPQLRDVNLGHSVVGDGEMKYLAANPTLTSIQLFGTGVGDAGARELAKSPVLIGLELWGTPLTDTGLAALAGCRSLNGLFIVNTKVTPAGVAAFRRARPDCRVYDKE